MFEKGVRGLCARRFTSWQCSSSSNYYKATWTFKKLLNASQSSKLKQSVREPNDENLSTAGIRGRVRKGRKFVNMKQQEVKGMERWKEPLKQTAWHDPANIRLQFGLHNTLLPLLFYPKSSTLARETSRALGYHELTLMLRARNPNLLPALPKLEQLLLDSTLWHWQHLVTNNMIPKLLHHSLAPLMDLLNSINHPFRAASPTGNFVGKCFDLQTPVVDIDFNILEIGSFELLNGVWDQKALQSVLQNVGSLDPRQQRVWWLRKYVDIVEISFEAVFLTFALRALGSALRWRRTVQARQCWRDWGQWWKFILLVSNNLKLWRV